MKPLTPEECQAALEHQERGGSPNRAKVLGGLLGRYARPGDHIGYEGLARLADRLDEEVRADEL